MKKKLVEQTPPVPTRKKGYWITVQMVGNILVLNMYRDRKMYARHCLDTTTGEYQTLAKGVWRQRRIESALGIRPEDYTYYITQSELKIIKERFRMSEEGESLIMEKISPLVGNKWKITAEDLLMAVETTYGRRRRNRVENNRIARVNAMMERIPDIPAGIEEWMDKRVLGSMDYMTRNEDKTYTCSECAAVCKYEDIKSVAGSQIRHKDMVICPECGTAVQVIKRSKVVKVKAHFSMIQPVDDEISVARHFTGYIECGERHRKALGITEDVRIVLFKKTAKAICDIYYEQYTRSPWIPDGGKYYGGCFDNKHNPANKRECAGYLYDAGIEDALKNTAYEPWTRLFVQLSAAGMRLNYNKMMTAYKANKYIALIELLFRGRFNRLLEEQSEAVSTWNGEYYGKLDINGSSMEEVFGLADRQKINRIREKDGGREMIRWMQWSERHRQKISDKALCWLTKNDITTLDDMRWTGCRFTIEQAMNYMERQRKESYPGKTVKQVISQYEDYMNMCMTLGKDTNDEMVYRPRELKRRHDEAVLQMEKQKAQLKADEYSRKYPEAEKVLGEIKDKFEYEGDEFIIKVPERIVDVITEGRMLHHCAGSSDRYFDRMKDHETYICFCRKKAEPDTPFYTIEVEPGGTIRQHRGMYDEEPEIEKVKPFLKEWQKEIRKRMSEQDHERAAASKVKREANIKELKAKNNTRVLNGLVEDFMEAM